MLLLLLQLVGLHLRSKIDLLIMLNWLGLLVLTFCIIVVIVISVTSIDALPFKNQVLCEYCTHNGFK